MSSIGPQTFQRQLELHCEAYGLGKPYFQEYSEVRGNRTAWLSCVTVNGEYYFVELWRSYQNINQSREEAAEKALKALRAQAGHRT